MQGEGADFLQGIWIQDDVIAQNERLRYTLHEFKFVCDSIYTTLHMYDKVQNMNDSCYNNGQWEEYAKGVYAVRGDSLIVDGLYTKEDGKQKISGCHRKGQFLPRFEVTHISPDSVVLRNKYDHTPITLRKVENITCVPKKRWEM